MIRLWSFVLGNLATNFFEKHARLKPDEGEVVSVWAGTPMTSTPTVSGGAAAIGKYLEESRCPLVKVYAFEAYDPLCEKSVRAPCKMTMAEIESWRCVPIEGTDEEVSADKLDENGRYYPD